MGGIKTLTVDVRLIAATNKDLRKGIENGTFREDLFYRLNVVPIELPPLRDRTEDIPPLVMHFVERFNERLNRSVTEVTTAALEILCAYPWPGNIRELENIVERTLLFSDGPIVDVAQLPPDIIAKVKDSPTPAGARAAAEIAGEDTSMKDIVRRATSEIERNLITKALDDTGGNVTHAARALKISRKSLQIKMKELGLREPTRPNEELE